MENKNNTWKVLVITFLAIALLLIITSPLQEANDRIMAQAEAAYENNFEAQVFEFFFCKAPIFGCLIMVVLLLVGAVFVGRQEKQGDSAGQEQ